MKQIDLSEWGLPKLESSMERMATEWDKVMRSALEEVLQSVFAPAQDGEPSMYFDLEIDEELRLTLSTTAFGWPIVVWQGSLAVLTGGRMRDDLDYCDDLGDRLKGYERMGKSLYEFAKAFDQGLSYWRDKWRNKRGG